MDTIFNHLLEKITSEDAYKSFFKASITLFIFYFVATFQISSALLPIEKEAYELKFSFENSEGKTFENLTASDCNVKRNNYKDCAMSVHLNKTSESSINAAVATQKLLNILAYTLLFMSFLSFIFHSHIHKQKKQYEPVRKHNKVFQRRSGVSRLHSTVCK